MKPGATLPPREIAPDLDDEAVSESRRDPRVTVAVVALSVALGVMVLARLGHKSFWIDESYTWSTVARPWGSFVHLVRKSESQNLLYAALMWGWDRVGDTEAWLRFPSAVFAVLTVPSIYLAGKSLFDRKVGLVAAVLFTVNANAVQYGQEARAYMMAMLFGSLSIAGFAMMVRTPSRRATWLWVVSSGLLVYTHPWALFLVGAELVSLFFLRPPSGIWRRFRTGIIVIAVVALPAVLLLFSQRGSATNGSLPSFTLSVRYVTGVFGKNGPVLVLAWILLLGYGAFATLRAWPRASRTRRWQLAAAWCLPVVTLGLVVASDLFLGLFSAAHVATTLPTFAIVGAVALCEIRSTRVFAVALSVIAVLSFIGIVKWQVGEPKQDWRGATAYVLRNASPGDVVVFADDQTRIPFQYYARDSRKLGALVPGFPAAPWGHWGTGDQKAALPSSDYLAGIDAHKTRVWVVAAVAEPGVPGYPARGLNQLYDRLDHALTHHQRAATRAFDAQVDVFRYDPR